MFEAVIFSKDRAAQLDLTIQSIKKHSNASKIHVLFTYTNEDYFNGYERLKDLHKDVIFHKQRDSFMFMLRGIMRNIKSDYMCFFTDDNIMFGDFRENLGQIFDSDISCISLRLGLNIVKRNHFDLTVEDLPIYSQMEKCGDLLVFNKTLHTIGGYWFYDLSVDGHIFRTSDMAYMVKTILLWPEIQNKSINPNSFESYLQRFYFERPSAILCPKKSVVVNSPNNRVQNVVENAAGDKFPIDPEECNKDFLNGLRFYIDKLNVGYIDCPHKELDIMSCMM